MRAFTWLVAVACCASMPLAAQTAAPVMNFDSAANALTLPDDVYLGEVGGVATNSRGDIFVYTRTGHPTLSIGTARPFAHGGSRLFQFDRSGKFVKSFGAGMFVMPHGLTVDRDGNIWATDQNGKDGKGQQAIKFSPEGPATGDHSGECEPSGD